MAKKDTSRPTDAKKPQRANEIRIKEDPAEEYFRRQEDPYVLPPELNMTIRDGFRFGLGFILAMLLFYTIVAVGAVLFVQFGDLLRLG